MNITTWYPLTGVFRGQQFAGRTREDEAAVIFHTAKSSKAESVAAGCAAGDSFTSAPALNFAHLPWQLCPSILLLPQQSRCGGDIQMLREQTLRQTGSYMAVVYVAVSKAIHQSGLIFQRGGWMGRWDGRRVGEEVGSCQAQEEEERVRLQKGRKPIVSETRWKMPSDEAG